MNDKEEINENSQKKAVAKVLPEDVPLAVEPSSPQPTVVIGHDEPILNVPNIEAVSLVQASSTTMADWPKMPLVHYPPSSGSGAAIVSPEVESSTEETIVAIPSFEYFRLADRQTGDFGLTADRLVEVLLNIDDDSSVDGYFLSENSILGSSTSWLAAVPAEFLLSEGEGAKSVYAWISYGDDIFISSSSALISFVLPIVATSTATSTATSVHVLISEFSTRGQSGAYDEFIELYNPSEEDVDLSGWQIRSRSATARSPATSSANR